jgi:hypothetical protein
MKVLPLIFGLLLASLTAYGRETAYKALRAFGAERGQALLSRVVEVQGRAGTPQPNLWKIVLDDPNARGGVRVVEVQNSQIVAEHTPLRLYSGVGAGAVMDFQKLSLDSEGAFKIANMEAKNAQFGFDSIDYTLRVADNSNLPVWVLHFLDENQKSIGSIQIAADSGNVLQRNFGHGKFIDNAGTAQATPTPPPAPPVESGSTASTESSEPAIIPPKQPQPAQVPPDTAPGAQPDAPRKPGLGHEIKKGFVTAGAAFEEFFTGKRTLDRKYRNPPEPQPQEPYRGDD